MSEDGRDRAYATGDPDPDADLVDDIAALRRAEAEVASQREPERRTRPPSPPRRGVASAVRPDLSRPPVSDNARMQGERGGSARGLAVAIAAAVIVAAAAVIFLLARG